MGAYEQGLETYRQLGDRYGISTVLHYLGTVNRVIERFDVAEDYLQEALDLKRELADRRGLVRVLISLAILRINQDRWREARELVGEAVHLAQETQANDLLARAYTLWGAIEMAEDGNLVAGAADYAQAVLTAWEHHRMTGQNINYSILHQLRAMARHGEARTAQAICERILSAVRERGGIQYPETVAAFEELLSDLKRSDTR